MDNAKKRYIRGPYSTKRPGIQASQRCISFEQSCERCKGVVMDVDAVARSALQRNVLRFFAATLLAVICIEAPPVSAAECGQNCDLNVQPRQSGDPRCVPRPIVPKDTSTPFPAFQSNGPHCDFRVRRRQAHHQAPSLTPQTPSTSAATLQRAPGAGKNVVVNGANQSGAGGNQPGSGASDPGTAATDPSRQVPRSVDRDVGFADAFGTRVDELHASPRAGGIGVGAGGLGVGVGAGGLGAGGVAVGAGGVARGRP
jgi:hypothetical protein